MIDVSDATFALAAGVVERAHDLIDDGWVKGKLYDSRSQPTRFCILGALQLAAEEVIMQGIPMKKSRRDEHHEMYMAVKELVGLCSAIIADAAGMGLNGSPPTFNDAPNRKQAEVLAVMRSAAETLWDISLNTEREIDMSSMLNTGTSENVKSFLEMELVA